VNVRGKLLRLGSSIVLVLTLTGAGDGSGAAHGISDEHALQVDAEWYAAEFGVNDDEAFRRLKMVDELRGIVARVQVSLPDRFAGAWFQHGGPFGVVMNFTGSDVGLEAAKALAASAPAPLNIVVGAPMTLREMEAEIAALSADLRKGQAAWLDLVNGQLVMTQPGGFTPAGRAAVDARANLPVRFEAGSAYSTTHTYGGRRLEATGELECTTGFTVQHTGPGFVRGVTTSAHCRNPLRYVEGGGVNYPLTLMGERNDAERDAEWNAEGAHAVFPRFWDGNQFRNVMDLAARIGMVNDPVCHYGAFTGRSCGVVQTIHFDPGNICGPDRDSNCASTWVQVTGPNVRCFGGDSGGPWFRGGIAYGLQTHGDTVGPGTGQCFGATFMSVGFIETMSLNVLEIGE
jgi:streptogrisin C